MNDTRPSRHAEVAALIGWRAGLADRWRRFSNSCVVLDRLERRDAVTAGDVLAERDLRAHLARELEALTREDEVSLLTLVHCAINDAWIGTSRRWPDLSC